MRRFFLVCASAFILSASVEGQEMAEDKAVQRGVAFLRGLQQADGSWQHPEKVGMTALAGLTLLEGGAADDDAVERAAAYVRQQSVTQTHTYSLALAILFLDKLGAPTDESLIQSLSVRLLTGQNPYGGWSYHCPGPTAQEVARLKKLLENPPERPRKDEPKSSRERRLSQELQWELGQLQKVAQFHNQQPGIGDTSNTAFAAMGLEVARQYGLPVNRAMQTLEERFAYSQRSDGGWNYCPVEAMHTFTAPRENFKVSAKQVVKVEKVVTPTIVPVHDAKYAYAAIEGLGLTPWLLPQKLAELRNNWAKIRFYSEMPPVAVLQVWGLSTSGGAFAVAYYPSNALTFRRLAGMPGKGVSTTGFHAFEFHNFFKVPSEFMKLNPPPPVSYVPPFRAFNKKIQMELEAAYRCDKWVPSEFWVFAASYEKSHVTTYAGKSFTVIQTERIPSDSWMSYQQSSKESFSIPSQGETGKIANNLRSSRSTPPMTSDALIAISVARSFNQENPLRPGMTSQGMDLMRKTAVNGGLTGLGNILSASDPKRKIPSRDNTYYSLWSLGQMSLALGLTSIGQRNWHGFGTEMLLHNQQPNGSWQGSFGAADTCFALLFLRKSNWLAQVSDKLKDKIADPALGNLVQRDTPGEKENALEKAAEQQASQLRQSLANSNAVQQQALLTKIRDSGEPSHTLALAVLIPQVSDKLQNNVRVALAERLAKKKPQIVRESLVSRHVEIRKAACHACRYQNNVHHVPHLIPLLTDEDGGVGQAALRALKGLTRQDLGPEIDAPQDAREAAVQAWLNWWQKQKT